MRVGFQMLYQSQLMLTVHLGHTFGLGQTKFLLFSRSGLSLLLFASKLIMIQQSEGISQRKQLFVEIQQVILFKF